MGMQSEDCSMQNGNAQWKVQTDCRSIALFCILDSAFPFDILHSPIPFSTLQSEIGIRTGV